MQDLTCSMSEGARTDQWEPWGSNPLGRPGPELSVQTYATVFFVLVFGKNDKSNISSADANVLARRDDDLKAWSERRHGEWLRRSQPSSMGRPNRSSSPGTGIALRLRARFVGLASERTR